jgi:hypothetical protein
VVLSIYEKEEKAIIQEFINSMSAEESTSHIRREQIISKTKERIDKAKLKQIKRGIKV